MISFHLLLDAKHTKIKAKNYDSWKVGRGPVRWYQDGYGTGEQTVTCNEGRFQGEAIRYVFDPVEKLRE